MPQENGHRSARPSSRSSTSRVNSSQNGTDKTRSAKELKERGFYSELATIDPHTNFEVTVERSAVILYEFDVNM